MEYLERAKKIMRRINELALLSESDAGITRTFGTSAFMQGVQKVQQWMLEAGLETRIDQVCNVRGLFPSKQPGARKFVIASHIDTVINAGRFDGPLGVLAGLDLLEELRRSGTSLPFDIELIAFSDEEGVRFHTTYLGSKVVAGSFEPAVLEVKDEAGISLGDLLNQLDCFRGNIAADAIAPGDWLGYFEMHIEQGPVLYEKKIPVAIVTGIAGQIRLSLRFQGMAGHAGTVPMPMRSDALAAAASFVVETEKFALANQHQMVATIGMLTVPNAASNVIPGEVQCSLDIRSQDNQFLQTAQQQLRDICRAVCEPRNCSFEWTLVQETAPVQCDSRLAGMLSEATASRGHEIVLLVSGAGHDAVPVSAVAPVSMLFVRCFKGISHNPLEDVELEDLAAAIAVGDSFLTLLLRNQKEAAVASLL